MSIVLRDVKQEITETATLDLEFGEITYKVRIRREINPRQNPAWSVLDIEGLHHRSKGYRQICAVLQPELAELDAKDAFVAEFNRERFADF